MHRLSVTGMSWHPRGDRIASCSSEGPVVVWNPVSGEELVRFGTGQKVEQVARVAGRQNPGARVEGGELRLWDSTAGYELADSALFQEQYKKRRLAEFDVSLRVDDRETAWRLWNAAEHRDERRRSLAPVRVGAHRPGQRREPRVPAGLREDDRTLSQITRCRRSARRRQTCTVGPEAVRDFAPLIACAEDAVRRSLKARPPRPCSERSHACRSIPGSAAVLGEAMTMKTATSVGRLLYFLAMADWRSGHFDEAKQHSNSRTRWRKRTGTKSPLERSGDPGASAQGVGIPDWNGPVK